VLCDRNDDADVQVRRVSRRSAIKESMPTAEVPVSDVRNGEPTTPPRSAADDILVRMFYVGLQHTDISSCFVRLLVLKERGSFDPG